MTIAEVNYEQTTIGELEFRLNFIYLRICLKKEYFHEEMKKNSSIVARYRVQCIYVQLLVTLIFFRFVKSFTRYYPPHHALIFMNIIDRVEHY